MKRITAKKLGEQFGAVLALGRAVDAARKQGLEVVGAGGRSISTASIEEVVDLQRHELLAAAVDRAVEIFDAIDGEIEVVTLRGTGQPRDRLDDRTRGTIRQAFQAAGWEMATIDYVFKFVDDLVNDGAFHDSQSAAAPASAPESLGDEHMRRVHGDGSECSDGCDRSVTS